MNCHKKFSNLLRDVERWQSKIYFRSRLYVYWYFMFPSGRWRRRQANKTVEDEGKTQFSQSNFTAITNRGKFLLPPPPTALFLEMIHFLLSNFSLSGLRPSHKLLHFIFLSGFWSRSSGNPQSLIPICLPHQPGRKKKNFLRFEMLM